MKNQHKYNAKKVTIDAIVFDSKNEALYYTQVVKPGIEDKTIVDVVYHPKFILLPKYERIINGKKKKFQAISYSADFQITYNNGLTELIDIKGAVTKEFKDKYKWFHYIYDNHEIVLLKPIIRKTHITWERIEL